MSLSLLNYEKCIEIKQKVIINKKTQWSATTEDFFTIRSCTGTLWRVCPFFVIIASGLSLSKSGKAHLTACTVDESFSNDKCQYNRRDLFYYWRHFDFMGSEKHALTRIKSRNKTVTRLCVCQDGGSSGNPDRCSALLSE